MPTFSCILKGVCLLPRGPWHQFSTSVENAAYTYEKSSRAWQPQLSSCGSCMLRSPMPTCVQICFSQTLSGDYNSTAKAQKKTRNMKLAETKRLWGKGQGEKETKDIYFPSFKDHGSQANERPWRKPYFPEYVWQCRGDWRTLYRLSVLWRFILHNSWNSRKFPQDWQKACLELIF